MRLAVVGSRKLTNYSKVKEVLNRYYTQYGSDLVIVSGGAAGADSMAEWFAKEHGLKTHIIKPDWNKHGKSAGFIRNQEIWDNADAGVAFWDGKSKGTAHSFKISAAQDKDLEIVLTK